MKLDRVARLRTQIDGTTNRASKLRDERNALLIELAKMPGGPTLTELARRAGVAHSMVSRLSRGLPASGTAVLEAEKDMAVG